MTPLQLSSEEVHLKYIWQIIHTPQLHMLYHICNLWEHPAHIFTVKTIGNIPYVICVYVFNVTLISESVFAIISMTCFGYPSSAIIRNFLICIHHKHAKSCRTTNFSQLFILYFNCHNYICN